MTHPPQPGASSPSGTPCLGYCCKVFGEHAPLHEQRYDCYKWTPRSAVSPSPTTPPEKRYCARCWLKDLGRFELRDGRCPNFNCSMYVGGFYDRPDWLTEAQSSATLDTDEGGARTVSRAGAVSNVDTMRFCCPKCGGSHFGSWFNGSEIAGRECHDEFGINCRWTGSDTECFPAPTTPAPRCQYCEDRARMEAVAQRAYDLGKQAGGAPETATLDVDEMERAIFNYANAHREDAQKLPESSRQHSLYDARRANDRHLDKLRTHCAALTAPPADATDWKACYHDAIDMLAKGSYGIPVDSEAASAFAEVIRRVLTAHDHLTRPTPQERDA